MSEPVSGGSVAVAAAPAITAAEAASVGLSAAQAAAVTTLVESQSAARARVLAGTVAYLTRLLGAFTGWYDEAEVLRFASAADGQVRKAQQVSADLTLSYQRQMLARLGVGLSRAEQARARFVVPPVGEPGLRGIDFLAEWERPVKAYRYERSTGADQDAAIAAAVARVQRMADAAETLAMRRASQRALTVAAGLDPDFDTDDDEGSATREVDADADALGRDLAQPVAASEPPPARPQTRLRVVGYRRVLHPELSTTGVCGLCLVAADRRYTVQELMPIHALCRCTVAPIVERDGKVEDPGKALNEADLERVYRAGGGTDRASLKRVKIRIDEHGELGEVIAPASQRASVVTAPRLQRGQAPGESELDLARRRLSYLENEVDYIRRAVRDGQSKYAPTLALRERALAQHRVRLARLVKAAPAA